MNIDYKKLIISISAIIIIAVAAYVFAGCISAPKAKEYEGRPVVCLDAMRCLYYNQKNPDKSVCAALCKECAAYERMKFCNDPKNRPEGVNFQSCWDKIE